MFSKIIRADLNPYSTTFNSRGYLKALFTHPGARFMFLYRKCQANSNKTIPGIFYRVWLICSTREHSVEIPHAWSLEVGLYMGHFKAIIINKNARIGNVRVLLCDVKAVGKEELAL